ncbi:MAG: ATP-binding protein [Armatimonadetes bacterium]|nr:ATP-binding protein [Armatimonadota bacterium]
MVASWLRQHQEPLHDVYSRAVVKGRGKQIIQNLKSIVTDIENVQILTENNRVVLSLVFPDYGIPIWLAGDGIVSLFRLCVDLAALPDGVVLMEEPETHLHPGAVWQSAQVIWAAVRDGVQIILSTHSLEFVDALIAKSKDEDELQKMSVYRTQLKNGNLETRCLPGPDVQFKRSEIGDDLR